MHMVVNSWSQRPQTKSVHLENKMHINESTLSTECWLVFRTCDLLHPLKLAVYNNLIGFQLTIKKFWNPHPSPVMMSLTPKFCWEVSYTPPSSAGHWSCGGRGGTKDRAAESSAGAGEGSRDRLPRHQSGRRIWTCAQTTTQ